MVYSVQWQNGNCCATNNRRSWWCDFKFRCALSAQWSCRPRSRIATFGPIREVGSIGFVFALWVGMVPGAETGRRVTRSTRLRCDREVPASVGIRSGMIGLSIGDAYRGPTTEMPPQRKCP